MYLNFGRRCLKNGIKRLSGLKKKLWCDWGCSTLWKQSLSKQYKLKKNQHTKEEKGSGVVHINGAYLSTSCVNHRAIKHHRPNEWEGSEYTEKEKKKVAYTPVKHIASSDVYFMRKRARSRRQVSLHLIKCREIQEQE